MKNIIDVLKEQEGFQSASGALKEDIDRAEYSLSLSFSDEFRKYLAQLGSAAFRSHELTGITKSSRLSVIDVTKEERAKNPEIPLKWYVVEQLHIDDVSIWQAGTGEIYQVIPGTAPIKLCDSLVEYIES